MNKNINYLITELSHLSVLQSTVISELQVINKECQELQNELKESKRVKSTKVELVRKNFKSNALHKGDTKLRAISSDSG